MAFQLSPGVLVTEKDLTLIVPAISTTAGGFVGAFQWGPVDEVTLIDSEANLVETFQIPNDTTFKSFFTAANFLSYGNNLQVIRVVREDQALNSAANTSIGNSAVGNPVMALIKNEDDYDAVYSAGSSTVMWSAKYPGVLGNSLRVSMCDANTFARWEFTNQFDVSPNTSTYANVRGGSRDELHVCVVDEDGAWTGVKGEILEKFQLVSKASDAKKADGSSNYYVDVINNTSEYIWWRGHLSQDNVTTEGSAWGTTASGTQFKLTNGGAANANATVSLIGGVSSDSPTDGNLTTALNTFLNDDLFDISLLPLGEVSSTVAIHAINQIAEVRKDCVVFISPESADVVNNAGDEPTDVVEFRNLLPSSSYATMDSGYKYQFDRFNDTFRYVPLNGDTAGLCVRTDFVADPFFSPAGFNRGQVKNVIKLPFSPRATQRDVLYKNGVNPVVTFPGQGTVLFGDKTLLAKPSAFDRINVRRLFIVLEKSIATAAKFQLFEFNDAFTRSQFRNLVEPFLRDNQGRRGITDFKVVCDETNNTGEVIDRNEFIADIFIKPARAINFIQLNFVATRTGISFEEVGG